VLPLCVLAVGAVVVALAARRLAAELAAMEPEVAALVRLRDDGKAMLAGAEVARRHGAALADAPARLRRARRSLSDTRVGGIDR
jgi:hypothetical protein